MDNNYKGLNDVEVLKNHKIYGLNELDDGKKDNFFIIYILWFFKTSTSFNPL